VAQSAGCKFGVAGRPRGAWRVHAAGHGAAWRGHGEGMRHAGLPRRAHARMRARSWVGGFIRAAHRRRRAARDSCRESGGESGGRAAAQCPGFGPDQRAAPGAAAPGSHGGWVGVEGGWSTSCAGMVPCSAAPAGRARAWSRQRRTQGAQLLGCARARAAPRAASALEAAQGGGAGRLYVLAAAQGKALRARMRADCRKQGAAPSRAHCSWRARGPRGAPWQQARRRRPWRRAFRHTRRCRTAPS
jgi:hypothetical protein